MEIPDKTPWCVLGPLDAWILLAGTGVIALIRLKPAAAIIAAGLCATYLGFEAWRLAFHFASDPRNLYVYGHTTTDVFDIRDEVAKVAAAHGRGIAIQVVGANNLWPLPWYLRPFPHVEWWRQFGPGFKPAPVILATPDMEPALIHELYEVPPPGERNLYAPLFERRLDLRPGVEIRGYVRAGL